MSADPPTVADMTTIETLRAVHHPTRRRMIDLLYLHGPSQVGTLARELGEQVGQHQPPPADARARGRASSPLRSS